MFCRDMACFTDKSFDVIIDKGTLDAVVCGENATEDSLLMLKECLRCAKTCYQLMQFRMGSVLT